MPKIIIIQKEHAFQKVDSHIFYSIDIIMSLKIIFHFKIHSVHDNAISTKKTMKKGAKEQKMRITITLIGTTTTIITIMVNVQF